MRIFLVWLLFSLRLIKVFRWYYGTVDMVLDKVMWCEPLLCLVLIRYLNCSSGMWCLCSSFCYDVIPYMHGHHIHITPDRLSAFFFFSNLNDYCTSSVAIESCVVYIFVPITQPNLSPVHIGSPVLYIVFLSLIYPFVTCLYS